MSRMKKSNPIKSVEELCSLNTLILLDKLIFKYLVKLFPLYHKMHVIRSRLLIPQLFVSHYIDRLYQGYNARKVISVVYASFVLQYIYRVSKR